MATSLPLPTASTTLSDKELNGHTHSNGDMATDHSSSNGTAYHQNHNHHHQPILGNGPADYGSGDHSSHPQQIHPSFFRPPPPPTEHRKFANPAPLGLSAFALTTFVLSLINLRTRRVNEPNIVVALAFGYGGLVQLLAGMWLVLYFVSLRCRYSRFLGGGCMVYCYYWWTSCSYLHLPVLRDRFVFLSIVHSSIRSFVRRAGPGWAKLGPGQVCPVQIKTGWAKSLAALLFRCSAWFPWPCIVRGDNLDGTLLMED